MQYPIIDLIINAYINNGWTGLDISTGKNLFDSSLPQIDGFLKSDGSVDIFSGPGWKLSTYIPVLPNTTYTFNPNSTEGGTAKHGFYTEEEIFISSINSGPITFTTPSNCYYMRFSFRDTSYDIQLEYGTQATPFEPYSEPKNDFPNRLKLPLPHYFPHPVIDALQRAAAGTQTAGDTEILRHYLTPLGIGGI